MPPVSIISDEELLRGLSSGDTAALEILMRRYYAVLRHFAQNFVPDSSLAEDVIQECFIKLWGSGKSFDSILELKAYLYASIRNGCLNMLRNRARLNERHHRAGIPDDVITDPGLDQVVEAEAVAIVYEMVRAMPEKMQQVFLLSYRDGMTVSEIARHLGIRVKTVKKRKYKVLVALRKHFAKH